MSAASAARAEIVSAGLVSARRQLHGRQRDVPVGRPVRGVGAADPHHVRGAAAVLEVAVHRVREVVAVDEVTEVLPELRPVGDEHGLVQGAAFGESHEGGHGGPDGLDRPRTRRHFLHVHAGREVTAGHLGCLPRCVVSVAGGTRPPATTTIMWRAGARSQSSPGGASGGCGCTFGRPRAASPSGGRRALKGRAGARGHGAAARRHWAGDHRRRRGAVRAARAGAAGRHDGAAGPAETHVGDRAAVRGDRPVPVRAARRPDRPRVRVGRDARRPGRGGGPA